MTQPKTTHIQNNQVSREELVNYCLQQIQGLNDNITFADTKIGIVSTISLAIIAVLAQYLQTSEPLNFSVLLLLSIISYGISVIFGLLTIFPRLITSNRNIFFWKSISEFETTEKFLALISNMSFNDFLIHSSNQIRSLSSILRKKYKNIQGSLIFFLIGLGLSIIYLGAFIISKNLGK